MEDKRNSLIIFRISYRESKMNERKAIFVELMAN